MTRIKDLPTFETLDPTNWIAVDSNEDLEPSGKASPATLAAFVNSDLAPVLSLTEGAGISISGDPQNPIISSTGSGVGDMLSVIYDPQNISSDAFARGNHTGQQPISATTGLQSALDASVDEPKLTRRLSARVGGLFDTVADLLADTTLTYSNVSPGDIIEAQGFRYEVLAEDDTDWHVMTAGGVRLRVLVNNDGRVSLLQFGQPSGVDDTEMMQKAFDNFERILVPNIGQPWMVDATSRGEESSGGAHVPTRPRAFDFMDNHEIELGNGVNIDVIPNGLTQYTVFMGHFVKNITVHGKGYINGERAGHTGTGGEWGHGIAIYSCTNVTIQDVELSDFWGDGLYLGDSEGLRVVNYNTVLLGVTCRGNRRQGMSVIVSDQLFVAWCKFIDTNGTAPQSGADLETNQPDQIITNSFFFACHFGGNSGQGFVTSGPLDSSHTVQLVNCTFENNYEHIRSTMKNTIIDNCTTNGEATNYNGGSGAIVIHDGAVRNCRLFGRMYEGICITGHGDVEVSNCSSKYDGVDNYVERFILISKPEQYSVRISNCRDIHAYRYGIMVAGFAGSTVPDLEIQGATISRYDPDIRTNTSIRVDPSAILGGDVIIKDVRFIPVPGSRLTSTIVAIRDGVDTLLTGCDVKGWDRSATNWYSGNEVNTGYGNRLPDGTWG